MTTFAFYATTQEDKRSDGANFIVASGPDQATARSTAESLINDPGGLNKFLAVTLDDSTPPVIVQGCPVGHMSQSVWPTLTRGGNTLK